MKKLLVVLLALAMVFGLATSAIAAEYSDVSELDADAQDAIYRLSALDVLAGYPNGGFQPNANITRAEFAKIAVLISNLGDAADSVKNSVSQYSDVPAGVWYTGYVNMASAQGFFKGYADGSFKPNANINMAEVITVLLRIAGYDDNLVGSWPFDYIAMASKRGITDDVTFVSGAAATRAQVAIMTDATIDEEMVYWDADKAAYQGLYGLTTTTALYGGNFETIFGHNFKNGIVKNVVIAGWDVKDVADMSIALNYTTLTAGAAAGSGKALDADCYISDSEKFYTLNNLVADVYFNKAATSSSAKIVYIDVKATTEWSDNVDVVAGVTKVNDKKITVDGVYLTGANIAGAGPDQVFKIFYNKDGNAYHFQATAATANLTVVDKYDATNKRIDVYTGGGFSVKDKDVIVIKDGQIASLADLESGDVFFRTTGANSVDETIIVRDFVEGKLTAGDGTHLTIADVDYAWAGGLYATDITKAAKNITGVSDFDDAYNATVKFIKDPANAFGVAFVLFAEKDDTTTVYGIVTDATANINNALSSVTIYNQDGKEVAYPIVKSDNYNRPVWGTPGTAGANIYGGTVIEAKVSADGSIATKNIKKLVPYDVATDTYVTALVDVNQAFTGGGTLAVGYPAGVIAAPAAFDTNYSITGSDAAVARKDVRLQFGAGNPWYYIKDKTVAFDWDTTDSAATAIAAADLKAMNDIAALGSTCDYVVKVKDGAITALFFADSNISTKDTFGVATKTWYAGDNYITIDGNSYVVSSTTGTVTDKKSFVFYNLDADNEASVTEVFTATASVASGAVGATTRAIAGGYAWMYDNAGAIATTTTANLAEVLTVDSIVGSQIVLKNGGATANWVLASDARVFYFDSTTFELEEAGITAIQKNAKIYAMTTDKPADFKLQYVFVED